MSKTITKVIAALSLAAIISTGASAESALVSHSKAPMPVQSYVPFNGSVDLNSNYLLKRGIQNYIEGDYTTASMLLHRAIRSGGSTGLASFYMGMTKAKIGNTRDAVPYLLRANQVYSNAPQSYAALGQAYAKLGKTDKARMVLARLDKIQTCDINCASDADIQSARKVIQNALAQ